MNMAENRASLSRQAARDLADLPEATVDSLLESVGAPMTPQGWRNGLLAERRLTLMRIIVDLPDANLARLALITTAITDGDSRPNPSTLATTSSDRIEPTRSAVANPTVGTVFIVHGHDNAALQQTARVLERSTGLDIVVLREQPNGGRTLIEKFEEHAGEAVYAVVLLTADDEGGAITSPARQPRARQNVVFELGFFFGKLGRQNVAVLHGDGVEKPSDVDGIAYIPLDPGGAWKWSLAQELVHSGIEVDVKRIP